GPRTSPACRTWSIWTAWLPSSGASMAMSGCEPAAARRQPWHRPQAMPACGCWHITDSAKARARRSLPIPACPHSSSACGRRPSWCCCQSCCRVSRCQGQTCCIGARSVMPLLPATLQNLCELCLDLVEGLAGIQHPETLWLGAGARQVTVADTLEEGAAFLLDPVQGAALAGALHALLHRQVEQQGQVRAQVTLHQLFQRRDFFHRHASTATLVS